MLFVTLFTFSVSDFLLAQANLFQTFSSTSFHFFSTIDFTFLDSPTRKELNVTWICLRATEQPVTYTLDRFMNPWERDAAEWGSSTSCHTTRLVRLGILKHHGFNQKHEPFCSIAGLSMVPLSLLMFSFLFHLVVREIRQESEGAEVSVTALHFVVVCLKLQFPFILTGSTLPACSCKNPSLAADTY